MNGHRETVANLPSSQPAKESFSNDLQAALRELNEKISALPGNLEQGFQRAFERALKDHDNAVQGDGPSSLADKASGVEKVTGRTSADQLNQFRSVQDGNIGKQQEKPAENGFHEQQNVADGKIS